MPCYEVNLISVVGQQSEPDIICLGNGATETAPVDITDLEVLEKTTFPARLNGHDAPPL